MKQTKEAVLSEAIRTIDGFLQMKEYHYEPDSEHHCLSRVKSRQLY